MQRSPSRGRTRSQSRNANGSVDQTIDDVARGSGSTTGGSQTASPSNGGVDQAQLQAALAQVSQQITAAMTACTDQLSLLVSLARGNGSGIDSRSGSGGQAAPPPPAPINGPQSSTSSVAGPSSVASGVPIREPPTWSHKPIIARFNGRDSSIQVEAWLKLFDVAFGSQTNTEKVQSLIRHLDGEAITWFSEEVTDDLNTLSWSAIKDLMIQRFGDKLVRPIVAAQSRFMNREDTIKGYYEEKMRLLRRVPGLQPLDQVAMLTAGTPNIYKTSLMSARIKTPADWLELALELETVFKFKKPPPRSDGPQVPIRGSRPATGEPVFAYKAAPAKGNDKKKKPSKPCKYCMDAGVTSYHWHSECERRTTTLQAEQEETVHESLAATTAPGNGSSGRVH